MAATAIRQDRARVTGCIPRLAGIGILKFVTEVRGESGFEIAFVSGDGTQSPLTTCEQQRTAPAKLEEGLFGSLAIDAKLDVLR